jgi:putative hydrolase of the HAD superfamily
MEIIFCSSQVGFAKPSPEFFQRVQHRLGWAPAEMLLVGDDPLRDCAAARQAGWQALHLAREPADRLEGSLESLHQLVEWLGDS